MWLNLDYLTLIRWPTLILSLSCTAYLFALRSAYRPTVLLAWSFAGATTFHLAMVLEFAGECYWRPHTIKTLAQPLLQMAGPAGFLLPLLLFAYEFPRHEKGLEREQRLCVVLFAALDAILLALTFFNFVFLQRLRSVFAFESTYYLFLYACVGAQFCVVLALLLRKTVRLSDTGSGSRWRRLAHPRGGEARAARAVSAVLLLPFGSVVIWVLRFCRLLPAVTTAYLVSFCFLLFHMVFIVVYLSRTEERTTLQVKLVAGALVAVLGILSLAAVYAGVSFEGDYRNADMVAQGDSIRFRPNARGGYDIAAGGLAYDDEPGEKIAPPPAAGARREIPFAFPFFGERYRSLRVLSGPMVFLGEDLHEDGWGGYHPQPVIAPIIMNLDPARGGGVFVKERANRVIVTWLAVPEEGGSNVNTVQLGLHADGTITFAYETLAPDLTYRATQLHAQTTAAVRGLDPGAGGGRSQPFPPSLVGIHPGGRGAAMEPIRFRRDLPYSSGVRAAVFEAYDIRYYRYMHERMAPFALLFIASSVLVLFAFPLSLRQSVIRPLRSLYDAMKQADQGDLGVTLAPGYNDEIGFLGRSFNQMMRSIRRMHAAFRSLAEDSLDGILVVLQDGKPAYANRGVSGITGYSCDRIMETDFDELLRTAEFRDIAAYVARADEKGEPRHYATEITSAAGVRVPVELTVSRTLWLGTPARVAVLRDISARRREEERARTRLLELMRTDKLMSLGVLAAGMAHDISNPNQAILSGVALLRRACPGLVAMLGDRHEEEDLLGGLDVGDFRSRLPQLLDAIAGCSQRIDSIVKNLRAFSRDEPDRPPEELDVNEVVRSALELVSPTIRRATVNFEMTLAPDLPRVRGNAPRLEQVVINLILNACQALADREKRVAVGTRREPETGSVILSVEDEGVGIPQEHLARVTEPFFTTRRSSGGTGLGLHIAESIVKEHGGSLRFRSAPGIGTVAEVALPGGAAL